MKVGKFRNPLTYFWLLSQSCCRNLRQEISYMWFSMCSQTYRRMILHLWFIYSRIWLNLRRMISPFLHRPNCMLIIIEKSEGPTLSTNSGKVVLALMKGNSGWLKYVNSKETWLNQRQEVFLALVKGDFGQLKDSNSRETWLNWRKEVFFALMKGDFSLLKDSNSRKTWLNPRQEIMDSVYVGFLLEWKC